MHINSIHVNINDYLVIISVYIYIYCALSLSLCMYVALSLSLACARARALALSPLSLSLPPSLPLSVCAYLCVYACLCMSVLVCICLSVSMSVCARLRVLKRGLRSTEPTLGLSHTLPAPLPSLHLSVSLPPFHSAHPSLNDTHTYTHIHTGASGGHRRRGIELGIFHRHA